MTNFAAVPQPLIETRGLCKHFDVRNTFSREKHVVRAVDQVDLQIHPHEIFGLVGESGCGKSTLGRVLMRLLPPSSGHILFDGQDVTTAAPASARHPMQIIFQDPYSSLNPSFDVRAILWEGMRNQPDLNRHTAEAQMVELLQRVGLSRDYLHVYPHQLSGGQRQRVGIARALTCNPRFLIADEPTSALDVSIQAQILNLFIELQQTMGLTILFISHDISVIRYLCNRVAVMYLGQIVEQGPAGEVLNRPRHPYTASLLSGVPKMGQFEARERRFLPGEMPSPLALPPGCRFHPRCPRVKERCRQHLPVLESVSPSHEAACFFPEPES
jgi:peptide/nickel transport system ATP-binding protein/oligopeptide transport system ATP-binding protein